MNEPYSQSLNFCSVEGCTNWYCAKGFCRVHYVRWKKHGDPNTLLILPKGHGKQKRRDRNVMFKTVQMADHRWAAMRALGKGLPSKAVVHHHYGLIDTLVICPNQAYHLLLHKRMRRMGYANVSL